MGFLSGSSLFKEPTMDELRIDGCVKSVIDFSDIGFECGCMFNPVGNFSIVPYGDGYLASFRKFGYYITTELHQYVFT